MRDTFMRCCYFVEVGLTLKSEDEKMESDRVKNERYFRLVLKCYMYKLLIGFNFEALVCDFL